MFPRYRTTVALPLTRRQMRRSSTWTQKGLGEDLGLDVWTPFWVEWETLRNLKGRGWNPTGNSCRIGSFLYEQTNARGSLRSNHTWGNKSYKTGLFDRPVPWWPHAEAAACSACWYLNLSGSLTQWCSVGGSQTTCRMPGPSSYPKSLMLWTLLTSGLSR